MTEPAEVWALIVRADELVKYAPNRDATEARADARAVLDDAERLNATLDDATRARFAEQIALRRRDLDRYDAGDGQP